MKYGEGVKEVNFLLNKKENLNPRKEIKQRFTMGLT